VTGHVSSAHHKRHGWYRSPVTVSFTCTVGSAPVAAACPAPVRLTKSKTRQSVTVTPLGTDGGATTASVSPINIDRHRPRLHVSGAKTGRTYPAARHLRCKARDGLSGVASCRIHRHRAVHGGVTVVRWKATAVDVAGNVSRRHRHYKIAP
jgi:hypothetical protein